MRERLAAIVAVLLGAVLYLVFGTALGYAFWLAFPSPFPRATATGIAGAVVATGCNCCMVTGAIAGLIVSAGGSKFVFYTNPTVFFGGIAMAAVGLAIMSGARPLPWLLAGAVVRRWGGNVLRWTGDWMIGDVNLRFIPGYIIYLIGAGLVLKAWPLPTSRSPPKNRKSVPANRRCNDRSSASRQNVCDAPPSKLVRGLARTPTLDPNRNADSPKREAG